MSVDGVNTVWFKKWFKRSPVKGYIEVSAEVEAIFDVIFKKFFNDGACLYYVKDSRVYGYRTINEMQDALKNLKMVSILSGVKLVWGLTGANFVRGINGGEYQLQFYESVKIDSIMFGRKYKEAKLLDDIKLCKVYYTENGKIKKEVLCVNPIKKFMEVM
jgi:hypothetical protein